MPARGRGSPPPARSASPPPIGGLSLGEDVLNPKGHSHKWYLSEHYSGRKEVYLAPPFGLEFPSDQIGDDLVVLNVRSEKAQTTARR